MLIVLPYYNLMITRDTVIERIKRKAEAAGSQKLLAELWGLTPQELNDVVRGGRPPSKRVLAGLGLVAFTAYKRKPQS